MVDPQQALVLAEIRCLLLYVGCEIGLVPPSFAEALMKATFCKEVRHERLAEVIHPRSTSTCPKAPNTFPLVWHLSST